MMRLDWINTLFGDHSRFWGASLSLSLSQSFARFVSRFFRPIYVEDLRLFWVRHRLRHQLHIELDLDEQRKPTAFGSQKQRCAAAKRGINCAQNVSGGISHIFQFVFVRDSKMNILILAKSRREIVIPNFRSFCFGHFCSASLSAQHYKIRITVAAENVIHNTVQIV